MGWFTSSDKKDKPVSDDKAKIELTIDKEAERNKAIAEEIEMRRGWAVEEAQAKRAEWITKTTEAHEKDKAGFSFSCKRWGDFLNIFVERNGRRYSEALNLSLVTKIHVKEGNLPDENGYLSFEVYHDPSDGRHLPSTDRWPPDGSKFDVRPVYPGLCKEMDLNWRIRRYSHEREIAYFSRFDGSTKWYPKPFYLKSLEGYPRHASDDEVLFPNTDYKIQTPAGLGEQVKETILTEIDGYIRSNPPKTKGLI